MIKNILNFMLSNIGDKMKNTLILPNLKDLIIFLIPVIIFSYYLHVFDPGILTYDSFNQLHQISSGQFSNWHPFFHTFIELLCIKIYSSPISIAVLQIITFSAMWMIICKYNRLNDETAINKEFILQIIFTSVIALIPLNALYSITLWKDILFSYFLIFLCFLIKVLIDKENDVGPGFIILISLTMAIVYHLRTNGVIVILLFLVIFAVYLFRKNKTKKLFIYIPVLTVIFILLISSLNVMYDVDDTQRDSFYAKLTHVLADYDLNLELDESDRNKIHELISEKDIKEHYNPTISNDIYIYSSMHRDIYNNDKSTYIWIAAKYSLSNPLHFIKYLFESSPMVWDVTRDDDWGGTLYTTQNIEISRDNFYRDVNSTPLSFYDNVTSKNFGSYAYGLLTSFAKLIKDNAILNAIFNSTATCMYLSFLIMGLIHVITKSRSIYLVYLPNLMNIITIFLSSSTQDNRFLYANFLVFYLLVAIFIRTVLIREKSQD